MKLSIELIAPLGLLIACVGCDPNQTNNQNSQSSVPPNANASTNVPAHVMAEAILSPASDSNVRGTVTFTEENHQVRVEAKLTGLKPGPHGFHIHEKGDCSAPDASSAGGHFNPGGMEHGGPDAASRHLGDFGNLEADAGGNASYSRLFANLTFDGAASIIGKAVIVHANPDDLKTQPTGNAGSRVACGVIEKK